MGLSDIVDLWIRCVLRKTEGLSDTSSLELNFKELPFPKLSDFDLNS